MKYAEYLRCNNKRRDYLNYKTNSLRGRILKNKADKLMRNKDYKKAVKFYIKALRSFFIEFKQRSNFTNNYYYGNYDEGHAYYMNSKIHQIKRNIRKAKRILEQI